MSTDYTGDPTATQAPASAPAFGVSPIVRMPTDGQALNVASVQQDFKVLADYEAFLLQGVHVDTFFSEEFTGDVIDTGRWKNQGVTGTGASTVEADSPADGAWKVTATGGDGSGSISTLPFYVGTNDFRLIALVKIAAIGGAPSSFSVQFFDSNPRGAGFFVTTGVNSGKFVVKVDATDHNTTVSVDPANYQKLEAKRIGGVVTFLIDDVEVYSESIASDINTGASISLASFRVNSGTTTVYVDCVKFWRRRP